MHTKISLQTKHELLHALRERYQQAPKIEKTRILDEYVDVAECHRKHAIRLLTGADPVRPEPSVHGRRIYAEAVREALIVLWEAADRICGKRLKVVLPNLIAAPERRQHLALDPAVRKLVLAASPATVDRLLTPVRNTASRRKKRKPATKSSKQIPIRTFADWKDPEPGFLEIDFVSRAKRVPRAKSALANHHEIARAGGANPIGGIADLRLAVAFTQLPAVDNDFGAGCQIADFGRDNGFFRDGGLLQPFAQVL
jgi:hypothetical protein